MSIFFGSGFVAKVCDAGVSVFPMPGRGCTTNCLSTCFVTRSPERFYERSTAWYASASDLVILQLRRPMQIWRSACAFGVLLAIPSLTGCGGGPAGLYGISGTVKVDGAPLESGAISFEAMEGQRASSGAVVSGGEFKIPTAHGLSEGKYRVVVHASTRGSVGGQAAADAPPGESPPPPKELIPPDWNESSTHTIEVKKGGPFVFSFEIATKGK
jgi:hypothetical protein